MKPKKLSFTEKYRIDDEARVNQFIDECKQDGIDNGYSVDAYASKLKIKKSKGEVIATGYEVSITKVYNDFWEEDEG